MFSEPKGDDKPKEHCSNEYLSSFKVAQYVTREAEIEEEEEPQVRLALRLC